MKAVRSLAFLLAIFGLFFLSVKTADAFSVWPSRAVLSVEPDSYRSIDINLKNEETQDLDFKVSVVGVRQNNDGLPEFQNNISIAEGWVKPETGSIHIKSGASQKIAFDINIPPNALPGSYYLGLAAEPAFSKGKQVGIAGRIVSLLNLQISGVVSESIKIKKWNAVRQSLRGDNWQFELVLDNNSPVGVELDGLIQIKSGRGKNILKTKINLGNQLISYSSRALRPTMDIGDRKLWPGLYQAQIQIKYGITHQQVQSVIKFWYAPIWFVAALVVFCIAILIVIFFIIKRSERKTNLFVFPSERR